MVTLHRHDTRQAADFGDLEAAVGHARRLWPGCLILVGKGDPLEDPARPPVCIYKDDEDMADEKAIGEITPHQRPTKSFISGL